MIRFIVLIKKPNSIKIIIGFTEIMLFTRKTHLAILHMMNIMPFVKRLKVNKLLTFLIIRITLYRKAF